MDDALRKDSRKRKSKSAKRAKASPRVRAPAEKKRVRVVIADDDPIILEQIGLFLESHFDVVARVCNGRDLVEAVKRLSPSVVVADITMPEMSGIEAARLITKLNPDVKIVILSVYNDYAIIDAAFAAGASGYVVKLTASTELIPAITEVLAGRRYRPHGM